MKETRFLIKFVLLVLACTTSLLVSARELTKFTTICNTDLAVAGVGGMMQLGTGHIGLAAPVQAGTVKRALLYWHGGITIPSGQQPDPSSLLRDATLNGVAIQGDAIGFSSDNGWATYLQASEACRADVTAIVNAAGAGIYTFSGVTNISGASLVVFFDDGNGANNRDVILFDGNDSNSPNPYDADGWNVNLSGFLHSGGAARLQLHVSDGQSYQERDLLLNGQVFVPGPSIFTGTSVPAEDNYSRFPAVLGLGVNNTRLWDIATYDLTPFLIPGLNNLFFTTGIRQDFFSLVLAAVDVPAGSAVDCGAAPPPPVNNNIPNVDCNAPPVIEANGVTGLSVPNITASISDTDGDSLLVIWKLDGTPISTVNIAGTPGSPISTNLTLPLQLRPRLTDYRIDVTVSDGVAAPVTCSTSITVKDPIPPVIDCGLPLTVVAAPNGVAILPDLNASLTATDNVTPRGLLAVTQLPAVGLRALVGLYTVTILVKDEAGNSSTCQKTVIVIDNPLTPNRPPTVNCGPAITVLADANGKATIPNVLSAATASDDFTPSASLVLTQTPAAGSAVSTGTYDITVTVQDEGGKTNFCTTKFMVVQANQPPTLDCGADISVTEDSYGKGTVPNVLTSVTVTDDHTPRASIVLSQSPRAGTSVPKGTNVITVTARDASGLSATCTKLFIVKSRHIIPDVDCSLNCTELWPPNHRMVTVDLTAVGKNISGSLEVRIYSDEDDEALCSGARYHRDDYDRDHGRDNCNKWSYYGWNDDDSRSRSTSNRNKCRWDDDDDDDDDHDSKVNCGGGDGNFSPDGGLTSRGDLLLRAERRGDRDGRVYLVVIKGTSTTGDTSFCVGTVTVPHDQSSASRASVRQQASSAVQYFTAHGAPPSNYVLVGDGAVLGKKDGPNENGNSPSSCKIFRSRSSCSPMIFRP